MNGVKTNQGGTHQHFLQEAQVGLLLLLEVLDELGETLHVGWDIVLLHQVIPHGCGFADVLADLHQLAHHLSGTAEPRCGRACRRSERAADRRMEGKVSRHLWRWLRLGEIRPVKGVGRNPHWAPRVANLETGLNTGEVSLRQPSLTVIYCHGTKAAPGRQISADLMRLLCCAELKCLQYLLREGLKCNTVPQNNHSWVYFIRGI